MMACTMLQNLRNKISLASAEITLPAVFSALQLYNPSSSNVTLLMIRNWPDCTILSLSGIITIPSLKNSTVGVGTPCATHGMVTSRSISNDIFSGGRKIVGAAIKRKIKQTCTKSISELTYDIDSCSKRLNCPHIISCNT